MNIKQKLSNIKSDLYIRFFLSLSDKTYIDYQRRFLTRTLRNAQRDVPFYNKILKGIEINKNNCFEILSRLPIIDKNVIRLVDKDIYANYVDENWKSWHNTGGSTGSPLHFPTHGNSRWCLDGESFCQAWLYMQMSGSYKLRISSVDGRRVDESKLNQNIYWGTNELNFPYGITHYSTIYLNSDTFPYYLKHLNDEKPVILRGYPSGIYELAKLIEESQSTLDFKIKAIYLTSENILDYQVALIERVFDCKVWGQYGHSEASIFAVKRPHQDSYECHPLYGYVEVIGENGEHVQQGEVGEIVVTGFQYAALPFIRYRTGDLAEYGGIKNGYVILNKLLGRSGDYIIDKNGQKIYLVGFIFGGHLKAFNHINNWQIIQDEPGKLTLIVVKGNDYARVTEKELFDFFASKGFEINILYTSAIKKTARGKQPFMLQNIK